jgi:hypothetical protein
MIQRSDNPGLRQKAGSSRFIQLVADRYLDRDIPLKLIIAGLIDTTVAAFAEFLHEPIAAKLGV